LIWSRSDVVGPYRP